MIKLVGYFFILLSFKAFALVPVEGIIMGEAREEFQHDPLKQIYSDIYDRSKLGENKKLKLYQSSYERGEFLTESCQYLGEPVYSTTWQEKQAHRSIAATLQYIGLDASIKAIGAYANKLELSSSEFNILKRNLVNNYCSKNLSVFSLKTIEKSLQHYYSSPEMSIIPTIDSSPFATASMKKLTERPEARSREFDYVLNNFRAFCSWGGEVEDYRMLVPYLRNSFIMAFVFKNLSGIRDTLDENRMKVVPKRSEATVQVSCNDLICRKQPFEIFKMNFPLTTGSTGIETDLAKAYCHHFRYLDTPKSKVPQVISWVKSEELEEPVLETSQFISIMTGVPDLVVAAENFKDLPLVLRSNVDERWNLWARNVLGTFSRDLLYEESLKVKLSSPKDLLTLRTKGFKIDLTITLGEMDRLVKDNDKLDMSFNLTLSKNFLRSMKSRWAELQNEVDLEGQKKYRDEIAVYIAHQLKEKEKLLRQKIWNEDFPKFIADDLIAQASLYRGPLFDSYQDEMIKIPVKFSYGLFALSYLRYRADVAKGRLNLSL
ncbi:MAG: hypothetical protein ACLGHN_00650 [Bacteriovoracia bacterium]